MKASLREVRRVLASLQVGAAGLRQNLSIAAIAVAVGLLAHASLSRVLEATGGTPTAPLDDAYIHFQFARAFAQGEPLVYSPGAGPVAGATSILWPLALSVPYALGLREHAIVYAAWAFGFLALGLLAWEALKSAERFCSPLCAAGAAALVLAFGANTWFAASGMEVIPLAWLLLRAARRASEWCEEEGGEAAILSRRRELLLISWALPLIRPEGALGSVLIAGALALAPRARSRLWALPAALALLAPSLFNFVLAGEISATTAQAKWLPLSPYVTLAGLSSALRHYLELLLETILDGGPYSAVFLPSGSRVVLVASLLALPIAGYRKGVWPRAILFSLLALGLLIPGTYDCALCNRLRYLWPFFPAWMIGTAALADLLGDLLGRRQPELRGASLLVIGGAAGAVGGYLPFSMDDLARSARGIFSQQVSLGLWARDALPEGARIGVNDAGAISYFSGRRTFDIVGLTTRGEALHWSAGTGSRFEHYERLARERLPTHLIVYPEWFAIPQLLGEELTARYVPDATILGGPRMAAHLPDYSSLSSAEAPDPQMSQGQPVVDRLDVADLESEAEHGYQLFDAERADNIVVQSGRGVDGARARRSLDAFLLRVEPGGALVLRLGADAKSTLELSLENRRYTIEVARARWHEVRLELPLSGPSGWVSVAVRAQAGTFSALHYFSLGSKAKKSAQDPR